MKNKEKNEFSAIQSILTKKFREFFWPMPMSVPIDGYTGFFI
jgi:hypothetical protein